MLKHRRFAGAGCDTEQFDKLVREEMKRHQVRLKDVASPNETQAQSKAPGKIGLGVSRLSAKAPVSAPTPTVTNARGVLRPVGLATSTEMGPPKIVMKNASGKIDRQPAAGGQSAPPVVAPATPRPSGPRLSKREQAHHDEVDAFFRDLEREEAAEIARYQAEHPLKR
jgi:hypothetical protein